jgi:HK97 gp10 family phage protein
MDFSFKVEGLDQFKAASKDIQKNLEKELLIALDASGRQVVSVAKKSIMQGGKSGRLYKRRTVVHRASAPGEAPANDTGRLVNSIVSEVTKTEMAATVSAGKGIAKYARYLEYGTSKMAPRPFFFTAFESSKAWIQNRLNQAVARALKK